MTSSPQQQAHLNVSLTLIGHLDRVMSSNLYGIFSQKILSVRKRFLLEQRFHLNRASAKGMIRGSGPPNRHALPPPQLTSLLFRRQRFLCLISNFAPLPPDEHLAP